MNNISEATNVLVCVLHDRVSRHAFLIKTLASLYAQSYPRLDVLLINSSADIKSQLALKQQFPQLILQVVAPPSGIVSGRNQGLNFFLQQQYQYLLNLDDDIVLNPNCLATFLRELRNDPELGMVAPLLLSTENTILSSGGDYFYALGQPRMRKKPIIQLSKNNDFLTGSIGLLRREVVQQVGLFDSAFDPYGFEDIDYCLRIKASGFKLAVSPDATGYHLTPFSFHTPTTFNLYYTTKNRILCARKHMTKGYFWFLFLPWSLVRRGLYPGGKYLLSGHFDLFRSVVKAFVDGLLK